ncbi:MAG: YjbH domain-containing protein, partial [Bacteroides sp.]|nr:YjbH domain-containing protein [Bacteroides sp.]
WTEDDHERVYVLENSTYRIQGVGIGKAIDVIQERGLSEGKTCRVVVLNNNVPQISLSYHPIKGDTVPQVERRDWNVSYELGDTWKEARKIKLKNRSLFKIDVLVYPQLAFKNLILTQIYQVLFDLSPAIEVSLWKGMKLTAQVKFPVYNDGYGIYEGKIHPGHLTISQRFRLPYNIFGRVTAGYFNMDRYGIDADFVHPFKDERFAAMLRLGYTGIGFWDGFTLHYDPTMTFTWSVGGSFFWTKYNTQFTVQAQQFLYKEVGVKAEMIRHFRYCSIGFYAMKAQEARINGGFRFQVLLPPYKYKRYKSVPRINTSANMGIVYNSGNERYYYKEYKAEASDNIMEKNSFNPYF